MVKMRLNNFNDMAKLTKGQTEFFKYSMPIGWVTRFGKPLIEDLEDILNKNNFYNYELFDVKEKWGQLSIYSNAPEEWDDHEWAWEYISEHTCVQCGEFPVNLRDDGYVSPWCDKHFRENHDNISDEKWPSYENMWTIKQEPKLLEYLCISSYDKEFGEVDRWIDLKPFYDKIGYKYNKEDLLSKEEFIKFLEGNYGQF